MRYLILLIGLCILSEPIFATASSSSSSANSLTEGDIAGTLLKKRQKLQTIVRSVHVQKLLDADQRDVHWFEDVEFDLKKTLVLTTGRLGRLRDLQQPYQDWLQVALEEALLETEANILKGTEEKQNPRHQELTAKRLEIEATLSAEYNKILETPLKNLAFAALEDPKVPLESMTSYKLTYVDSK
ncbi:MAG: hypothetical protein ACTHJ4_04685, partial [Candidatus Nucleicultricaceae bacterium]